MRWHLVMLNTPEKKSSINLGRNQLLTGNDPLRIAPRAAQKPTSLACLCTLSLIDQ